MVAQPHRARARAARVALASLALTATVSAVALLAAATPAGAIMPLRPDLAEEAAKAGRPGTPLFPALLAPSAVERTPSEGAVDALLLTVEFPDRRANTPISAFEDLAFATTGKSLRTYYREVSYGRLNVGGQVAGWFQSGQSYHYYVNADDSAGTSDDYGFDLSSRAFRPGDTYPRNVWGLVWETVRLADSAGVDFARFDSDGDRRVDAVFIVHAGPGAEETRGINVDYIWSHKSNLTEYLATIGLPPVRADGVEIAGYVMVSESRRLGILCHEFGHALGLPDLYRTMDGGEQQSVVGGFDLMDNGGWIDGGATPSHLGAWCKYQLGWIVPIALEPGAGGPQRVEGAEIFAAAATDRPGTFYRLLGNAGGLDWRPGRPGRGEYFLIENRQARQDDFDRALPASGLAIWHVDESRSGNDAESADEHLVTLVQADGEDYTSFSGNNTLGERDDLWPGSRAVADFTPRTSPSSDLHRGVFSGVEITTIRRAGETIQADLSVEGIRVGAPYAYPNPLVMEGSEGTITFVFRPREEDSSKGTTAPIRVRVYDLSGTPVVTLEGSGGLVTWDCRNASRRTVASGAYVYVVESQGETAEGKIAIVR